MVGKVLTRLCPPYGISLEALDPGCEPRSPYNHTSLAMVLPILTTP